MRDVLDLRVCGHENHNPWRKRGIALETMHLMPGIATHPSCPRGVSPSAPDIPGEGPRALATLSLANASGCDWGDASRLPLTAERVRPLPFCPLALSL